MNMIKRLSVAALATVSAAALGGCVDDYGYGYGSVAVGYGPGYDGYYDGYYYDGAVPYGGAYDGYGSYGYPGYYGWYGGYYYPGSGFNVYDRDRRAYRWNDDQQRYWGGQQRAYRERSGGEGYGRGENWQGFRRGDGGGSERPNGQAFRGGGFSGGGARGGGEGRSGGGGGHHR